MYINPARHGPGTLNLGDSNRRTTSTVISDIIQITMKLLALCMLALLPLIDACTSGGPGLLFPHLPNNGDTKFAFNCDDCSESIPISGTYRFFGTSYNTLWLGSNGYVTLDAGQWRFRPQSSAFTYSGGGDVMIAPYFCDIYIPAQLSSSDLWKRETTDQAILDRADDIIHDKFGYCGNGFKSTHAFIATWQRLTSYCIDRHYFVGCPNHPYARRDVEYDDLQITRARRDEGEEGEKVNISMPAGKAHAGNSAKRNSFQVVIVTDGCDTFVLNHIHTIEWECCFAPNQMLFNAGDGVGFWKHGTPTSNALQCNSNVGVNGRWAYKVSGPSILDPNCNPVGTPVP